MVFEEDVIKALKKHDNPMTLSFVKSRFYGTGNYQIKSRMLEIAADVLGSSASEWVKELWKNYDEDLLYPIFGQQPAAYVFNIRR